MLEVVTIQSIFDVESFRSFLDYLHSGTEALGALILVLSATAAWLFNKYYSYLFWRYQKNIEIVECMIALSTEINESIKSYCSNFNLRSYHVAVRNAKSMETSGEKRRPLIISESGENFIFNEIKSRLTILPTDVIRPVVVYYTIENEFSASYRSLGNPLIAERKLEITLDLIKVTHRDAFNCIRQGAKTINALECKIAEIKLNNIELAWGNSLALFLAIILIALTVPW